MRHPPLAQHFPRPLLHLSLLSAPPSPTDGTRESKKPTHWRNRSPSTPAPSPGRRHHAAGRWPWLFAPWGRAVTGKGIPPELRATQGERRWKRQLRSPSSPAKPVLPASLLYPKQLLSSTREGGGILSHSPLTSPFFLFLLNTCRHLLTDSR